MEVVEKIIYSVIICFTMQSILPVCSLSSSGNEVDWLNSIINLYLKWLAVIETFQYCKRITS